MNRLFFLKRCDYFIQCDRSGHRNVVRRSTAKVMSCLPWFCMVWIWSLCVTNPASGQDLGVPSQTKALSGGFSRAGNPQCIARWARPSHERPDSGYYVGGSRAVRGEGRSVNDGTWGNDYAPWYSRVSLRWDHGRRYQSGGGQYESDRRNNPFKIGAPTER